MYKQILQTGKIENTDDDEYFMDHDDVDDFLSQGGLKIINQNIIKYSEDLNKVMKSSKKDIGRSVIQHHNSLFGEIMLILADMSEVGKQESNIKKQLIENGLIDLIFTIGVKRLCDEIYPHLNIYHPKSQKIPYFETLMNFEWTCIRFFKGDDLILDRGYFQYIVKQIFNIDSCLEHSKGYANASSCFKNISTIAAYNEKCLLYLLENKFFDKINHVLVTKLSKSKKSKFALFKTILDTIVCLSYCKPIEKIIGEFVRIKLDEKLLQIFQLLRADDCHTAFYIGELLEFFVNNKIITKHIIKLSFAILQCDEIEDIRDIDDVENYPTTLFRAGKALFDILCYDADVYR